LPQGERLLLTITKLATNATARNTEGMELMGVRSTFLTVLGVVLALADSPAKLEMSARPQEVVAGGSVELKLIVSGASNISALSWQEVLDYRLSIEGRKVGESAAGKSVACRDQAEPEGSGKFRRISCILFGINNTAVGDGTVMTAVVKADKNAEPGLAQVRLEKLSATSPEGRAIKLAAGPEMALRIVPAVQR
jgi:hypothetical protein